MQNPGLRRQLSVALGQATYPVESPLDLTPVLPDGPETRFEGSDASVTALELLVEADACEFPYDERDVLVEDLLEAIEAQQTD
jgi:hypothetical protein